MRSWLLAVGWLVAVGSAGAQGTLRWEARAEASPDPVGTVLAGPGLSRAVSTYLRLAGAAMGGMARRADGGHRTARLSLESRFVLDPDRARGSSLFGAGGLALDMEPRRRPRVVLTALVGVEGLPSRGPRWALSAGVGGGWRVVVSLARR